MNGFILKTCTYSIHLHLAHMGAKRKLGVSSILETTSIIVYA